MSSKAIALGIVGVSVSFAMLAFGYVAGSRPDLISAVPPAQASTPSAALAGRGDVETIVREYLIANPEILMEMQAALDVRERESQRLAQIDSIRSSSERIFNASYDGIVGNPQGSVTIVEFFDYNCGFCKRAMEDMEAMVAADPDLRFVLKEFPILGPDSQRAHVVSMAVNNLAPETYGDFHRSVLMGGRATEETAIRAALALGIDETALRAELKNPAIQAAFEETYDLANSLAVTGTPSYVVGDEVVFGALGRAVLAEKVELARAE